MVDKNAKKGSGALDQRLAKALAHPLRVRILEVVNERPISPAAFTRELDGPPLSRVAYHFRVLEKHGCIECIEEVKRRGAMEHIYRGTRRALFGDSDWARLPMSIRSGVAGTVLDGLATRLTQAIEAGTFDARDDRHLSWLAMVLDEEGWAEFTDLLASTLTKAQELQVEATERMAKSGEVGFPVTFGAMAFESAPPPVDKG